MSDVSIEDSIMKYQVQFSGEKNLLIICYFFILCQTLFYLKNMKIINYWLCANSACSVLKVGLYSFSFHLSITIDVAVAAVVSVFTAALKLVPKFKAHGGSVRENLALQNVQVTCLYIRFDLYILTLVLLNPDIPCVCKQCRCRSVGFFRSQLIWS